ncbi:MAG: rRNA maturation RNase YbeY [Candidatus Obscuribacterales bacterium]
MSPTVTLSNRQRKHKVDPGKVKLMADRIVRGVLADLAESPPDWLDDEIVEALSGRGQFSLVFVSDSKIRELNRQWRQKDSATDVLSFPIDLEPPDEPLPYEVGEIIVSLDRALEQSREYGHSFERELAFLITHGVLHVLGFDHEQKEDEIEMFGRQSRVLADLGYKRE